ncbi:LLM class flavin-dependent oxidoreductase [Nonomuraea sp. NPDC050790]|uniref:LLM class flavin-dependent oxidoreductase n=1 Tax=Nonomuraea sp. NPDC050790 TaxID=3364371 RepID=UPI0037986BC5
MLKLGVTLPSFGVDESAGVREHARHAEDLGLESIWVGDHLIPVRPFLDSTIVLATAAAVTERVRLGFGVMILALRPVAWAAKQVASLQHLSGGRVLLGIGSGGPVHGEAAWRAVGVPFAERGRRTDAALEVLPGLVEGKPTDLDGAEITLSPGAPMPPVLIGAGPLRRAARFGDESYPGIATPADVADHVRRLGELAAAYGRPAPRVTIGLSAGLGDVPKSALDAEIRSLMEYGITEREARDSLLTGPPEAAAEQLAALAEAGAHRVVAMPFTQDRLRQSELLAETGRLLMAR